MKRAALARLVLLAALVALASAAHAQLEVQNEFQSIPTVAPDITNWMTNPVTPIAHRVRGYSIFVSWMVIPYLILPQLLLLYAILKFRALRGRVPATFHENVPLEFAWTLIPALTLVGLAIPAYGLIRFIERMPEADVNVVINGHQFFWSYEYMDDGFTISDEPLVVPVGKRIVANITSKDVTHAWWVPAFGIKMDAVPGRNTQVWFEVEKTGWYKGQCAELCGSLHSKMYIDVFVVSQEEYDAWVERKRDEFLGTPAPAATDENQENEPAAE